MRFVVVLLLFYSVLPGVSKDKLYLKSGKVLKGEIIYLETDRLIFKKKSGDEILFTSDAVSYLILDKNISVIKQIRSQFPGGEDCKLAIHDAGKNHKRGAGNFTIGFFFGVLGFAGVAITSPKSPHPELLKSRDKLYSWEYMICYENKAYKKNVKMAGLGLTVRSIIITYLYILSFFQQLSLKSENFNTYISHSVVDLLKAV